jgi:apolipoprotein D and lipocalin family protein
MRLFDMTGSRRLLLASLVALTACAQPAPQAFRDLNVPMGASTRFEAAKFAGSWLVMESFTAGSGTLVLAAAPDGQSVTVSGEGASAVAGVYRPGVPGELIPLEAGQDRLVVMWVDEDFGTAAIGTVSGSYGALLNRTPDLRPDRAQAARDVFDFYGWDTGRLRSTAL